MFTIKPKLTFVWNDGPPWRTLGPCNGFGRVWTVLRTVIVSSEKVVPIPNKKYHSTSNKNHRHKIAEIHNAVSQNALIFQSRQSWRILSSNTSWLIKPETLAFRGSWLRDIFNMRTTIRCIVNCRSPKQLGVGKCCLTVSYAIGDVSFPSDWMGIQLY